MSINDVVEHKDAKHVPSHPNSIGTPDSALAMRQKGEPASERQFRMPLADGKRNPMVVPCDRVTGQHAVLSHIVTREGDNIQIKTLASKRIGNCTQQ
eukprot:TRINITY_DN4487_c0_g1_i2.p1 TRINITY_DN4487_c0_g1~~TRINITY_DN4487_c0_g1_i2.p1  ORF type:complete len:106 (-),score=4.61 TRINITY_DN4487_c0_g1_i2:66-356(-)